MSVLVILFCVVLALWAADALLLRGTDLSAYDKAPDADAVVSFPGHEGPSDGHWEAVAEIEKFGLQATGLGGRQRLDLIRNYMDGQGRKRQYTATITAVDAGGVPAEWVQAPGAAGDRRVLYLHGGAFIAGSPLSHRNITSRFSEISGAAVLAIDYRLMPEHQRRDGIEDCRAAYRWILHNGPDGVEPVSHLVIAGDSAGGNLCLSLAAWVRDENLRQADAVVALSPTVDSTFTSPSIVRNIKSDVMLGPLFRILLKVPAWMRRWYFLWENRIAPANPVVSPVFGDLSGLPPTLIQVSEAEMLLDDARRYVNKAQAAGTRAIVQSWGHMLHVWQMFYPEVHEAGEAWDEIRRFLESTHPAPIFR